MNDDRRVLLSWVEDAFGAHGIDVLYFRKYNAQLVGAGGIQMNGEEPCWGPRDVTCRTLDHHDPGRQG